MAMASSSDSIIASSLASSAAAAARIGSGDTDSSRSRTVEVSRTEPMNCGITASPPDRLTAPSSAVSSPVMIRNRVVLPVPLGPISAVTEPSPTRKFTSASSGRPSDSA